MKLNATISSIQETFSMLGRKNERQNYLLEYKFINYKTQFKVDTHSERTSLNLLCLTGPSQVFVVGNIVSSSEVICSGFFGEGSVLS